MENSWLQIFNLQYSDAAARHARLAIDISVVYYVVVDGVMIELPSVFAVPLEVFVGGRKDEFAPTVVDVDLEVSVLNLGERAFWEAEVVVQTVTVRSEGVGQHQRVYARPDGNLVFEHALALGGGHCVGSGFVDGDGGRGLSVAP